MIYLIASTYIIVGFKIGLICSIVNLIFIFLDSLFFEKIIKVQLVFCFINLFLTYLTEDVNASDVNASIDTFNLVFIFSFITLAFISSTLGYYLFYCLSKLILGKLK